MIFTNLVRLKAKRSNAGYIGGMKMQDMTDLRREDPALILICFVLLYEPSSLTVLLPQQGNNTMK